MAVYVDPLFTWPADAYRGRDSAQARRVGARNGHQWCHLFTDGAVDELHALARAIGMHRTWFQPDRDGGHYDLTPRRRLAALLAGAVEVDRERAVEIRRAQRARVE